MLILASASPRRRELLRQAGYQFRVAASQTEETVLTPLPPPELVRHLAERKALSVASQFPDDTILAADTVVALENTIFGKPDSPQQAAAMLQQLSNREHQVYTGYCVRQGTWMESHWVETKVTFFPIRSEEIAAYVSTGEPLDKAGAYGIQGRGALLVREIQGDFYNVVGLPLSQVYRTLQKVGITPEAP